MVKQRIAFLYLQTGGGHLSAATALANRTQELFGSETKCFTLNPIPKKEHFAKFLLEEGYRVSSLKIEKFWICVYEFNKLRFMQLFWTLIMTKLIHKDLARYIKKHRITKIVVLHFLLITPVYRVIRSLEEKIPMLTVVTDPFTAHSFWHNQPHLPKIVFSERAKEEAIHRYGAHPDKIHVFPIILKKQFGTPLSTEEIQKKKKELGFTPGKRLVFFAGGGEGYPRGDLFVWALLRSKLDVELCIVCGKDDMLKKQIRWMASRYPKKKTIVFGFVDFMFDLMNIADVVVSKGGPATMMEALILNKPLIITQYIYGQERGNVEFLVYNRVGFYVKKPRHMVRTVSELFDNPETYNMIQKRLTRVKIENGIDKVVAFILSY